MAKSTFGSHGTSSYGSVLDPKHIPTPFCESEQDKASQFGESKGDSSIRQQVLNAPQAGLRWLLRLQGVFGTELLVAIFAAEHLVKGFDHAVTMDATAFLWKAYHVPAVNVQVYSAIKAMPWSLKPVFGALSDMCPIWGLRKAPYMIIASIIGVFCYLAIGFDASNKISIEFCVVLLIGCNLQGSVLDLLTEAQYSERLGEKPEHGPDLVSFVWLGQTVMALVASVMVGPLLSFGGPHKVFLVCALPASVVLWPACRNYFGERFQNQQESAEQRKHILACWQVFIPVFAVLAGAIALTVAGLMMRSHLMRMVVALSCLAAVLGSIQLSLRPEISRIITFYILQSAVHVSYSGASFYFYTDTIAEYPEGPHFSKMFYTTVLGVVSAFCSLIGLWLYIQYFKHWGYQKLLYVTNIVMCFAYMLDIIQFKRLNHRLGIPDYVFVLGSHTCQRVIARIAWMPQVLLLSQMCPKGLEGTMYAILAGSANFGGSIASFLGAYLLEVASVNPKGQVGDTEELGNLWIPCLASAILPTMLIVFIPFMIPDMKQTDCILLQDPTSPTWQSPLSRWSFARQSWRSRCDGHLG